MRFINLQNKATRQGCVLEKFGRKYSLYSNVHYVCAGCTNMDEVEQLLNTDPDFQLVVAPVVAPVPNKNALINAIKAVHTDPDLLTVADLKPGMAVEFRYTYYGCKVSSVIRGVICLEQTIGTGPSTSLFFCPLAVTTGYGGNNDKPFKLWEIKPDFESTIGNFYRRNTPVTVTV